MREGISIEVSAADRERLAAVVADRNSPQKHVWRSRIILATAEGYGTSEIMRRAGFETVCGAGRSGSCAKAWLACCARRPASPACRRCRRRWKLSQDPAFAAKLRDVVGLYLDPPAHSLVLSVDEKSQIQALDRTQPGLPIKKGRAGTMTHDYIRHGTTTLFAALNVLDGTVIGQ